MSSHEPPTGTTPLLEVADLRVEIRARDRVVAAVNGVDLRIHAGETLAVLGESGSGKSVTAQALLGLLDSPPARVVGGVARWRGRDVLGLDDAALRRIRGREIAVVFQDPSTALNPVQSVGWQIAEPLHVHEGVSRRTARRRAVELLELVGVPDPGARARLYPHELSGGMRQRVMIAMALALDPALLIADEPTTALDVTVQAEILELLDRLRRERGMALLLITHDVGIVAEVADRVAVMYAGRVVETGRASELLRRPAHPYTLGLLRSAPDPRHPERRLQPIAGSPPRLDGLPSGCPFHPRCPFAVPRCREELPGHYPVPAGRPSEGGQPTPRGGADRHTSACHELREVLGVD